MRVSDALRQAHAAGVERLDAQWLLAFILRRDRAWLLAHDNEILEPAQRDRWHELLARRATGEPLAYVTGEREFCGLRLGVSPAVLIPRPETELLVRWAAALAPVVPAPTVVDLGTGSGAIALAIKATNAALAVTATDASNDALAVALENARCLQLDVEFAAGDWWQAVAGRRFGLAVSNPPYVAAGDPHLAALVHEPLGALTPGGDGLDALRQIVVAAPQHLLPGAWLLLEHGHDQAEAVQSMLREAGFSAVQTRSDLAGLARCTGGSWLAG